MKKEYRINLQLFSEEPPESKDPEGGQKEPKTYSEEEVQKMLQAETDRKVTKALQTAKDKWESEFMEKLEAEKKEAERLAKLSAEEKEKELLEKTKREIEEKETAIRLRELKLDTIELLSEKQIPVKFADMLISKDAETTMENVKKFESMWKEAIDSAVTERLKGKSPKGGGSPNANKSFAEMTSEERMELKEKDPVKYQMLREQHLNK